VHSDHLGSSTRLTDSAGAIVRSQGYKPYGSDAYLSATVSTKHQYTGQEKEPNGLYYYNARYYDPELGRFVSVDPAAYDVRLGVSLSLREALNPYLYALGNPVRFNDPTGLDSGAMEAIAHSLGRDTEIGIELSLAASAQRAYETILQQASMPLYSTTDTDRRRVEFKLK